MAAETLNYEQLMHYQSMVLMSTFKRKHTIANSNTLGGGGVTKYFSEAFDPSHIYHF